MHEIGGSAQEIFFEAIELDSAAEMDRFVSERCGSNATLAARVKELLQAHRNVGKFLEGDQATIGAFLTSGGPGTQPAEIGVYRLREQIGEGGFGVVFVAEQTSPVQRKVALKILKPGMDTKEVIARFNAERQALAMMDHPNIARVFDAGATELGRPYFVMELVRGVPITDYCDAADVDTRGRLKMFIDVCQAVQHAHLKGIIHRDLKPSNVMVTLYDGAPVVKVIDFGIAKAINQRLTDLTIYTRYRELLGTPMYMSPEQAEYSGLDVDTRSDVYSLGVLLYVLLTGTTPFDPETLQQGGLDEIRRIIREEEPLKPSARVSTLRNHAQETTLHRRYVDLRKLKQSLQGELDWIVMKAIEKDRTRRYESASALAADIERYLHGEPVQACPPTAVYQLQKFARRNAATLLTVSVVAIALLAGTAVSVWQAVEATSSRRQAEANLANAESHRRRAERNLLLAQDAMKNLKTQQELAEKARRVAEQNELKTRQLLYASDMRRAIEAWREHDLIMGLDRLRAQVPDKDDRDLRGVVWHLIDASFRRTPARTFEHGVPVTDCVVTADGKTLITAAADGQLRFWSLTQNELIEAIPAHRKAIRSIALAPGGDRLVSGGDDDHVLIWDVANRRQLKALATMRTGVESVAWSADGKWIAAGARYSEFRAWSDDGEQILQHDNDQRHESLVFSPDGKRLYVPTRTHVEVWSTETREKISQFSTGIVTNVRTLLFLDGGQRLLVGERFGALMAVMDAQSGALLNYLDSRVEYPQSLATSESGERVAFVAADGSLRLIQNDSSQSVQTPITTAIEAHRGPAHAVCFLGDSHVFTAGEDGLVKVWQSDELETDWWEIPIDHERTGVGFSSNTNRVLMSRFNDPTAPAEFDLFSGKQVGRLTAAPSFRAGLASAVSADGRWYAVGGLDGSVVIWDLKSGKIAQKHDRRLQSVIEIVFSPDGMSLAASEPDGKIVVWQTTRDWTSPPPCTKQFEINQARSIKFSPNGEFLAARASNPTRIVIWDIVGNKQRIEVVANYLRDHLGWSPDGNGIAVICDDDQIRTWNTHDGKLLFETAIYPTHPISLTFAPDGNALLSGHVGGAIRVWHIPSSQSLGAIYQSGIAGERIRMVDFVHGNRIVAIVDGASPRLLVSR